MNSDSENEDVDEKVTMDWKLDGIKTDCSWVVKKVDGYYCSLCLKTNSKPKNRVWVTKPCRKKDGPRAIRRHRVSIEHQHSVASLEVVKTIPEHQLDLNKDVAALQKRFRDLYWL
eukprot:Pompholyxophrys_punicea_v1_NODE_369_length_2134_cov_3.138047.p3 type:complete len:115 gc:universal NODE_369_length_2134_cov_3.138047:359-703(+)